MQIRIPARTLTMAAMLALAVLSGPAVAVQAKPAGGGHPQPVLCSATRADGEIEFFTAGEIVVDAQGRKFICASDGNFYRLASAIAAPIGTGVTSPEIPVQTIRATAP